MFKLLAITLNDYVTQTKQLKLYLTYKKIVYIAVEQPCSQASVTNILIRKGNKRQETIFHHLVLLIHKFRQASKRSFTVMNCLLHLRIFFSILVNKRLKYLKVQFLVDHQCWIKIAYGQTKYFCDTAKSAHGTSNDLETQ